MQFLRNIGTRLRKEVLDIEVAREILEKELNMCSHAADALRSYYKHLEIGAPFDVGNLQEHLRKTSNGKIGFQNSGLFTIDPNTQQIYDVHEGILSSGGIRGLHFFLYSRVPFECMVVDGGDSTEAFNVLDQRTKEQFARDFLLRRDESSAIYIGGRTKLRVAYSAFILEPNLHEYQIEVLVPVKVANPYLFYRS